MGIIGGEFEIRTKDFIKYGSTQPFEFNKGYFYSSGRAALHHILSLLIQKEKKKILLPDYLCESIVEVVKISKIPFYFYSINEDLSINIDSIKEIYTEKSSILIINYFGGIDVLNEIKKLRNIDLNISIILDNVQAFYSMFESFDVDFMFTSFRKQLPVPDGGWVISKYKLDKCEEYNSFAQYKLAGGLLKNFQGYKSISDKTYLELFEKGENAISENLNASISDVTIEILNKLNLKHIQNKRLENSAFLIEGLKKLGLEPILNFNSEMTPLFVPIILKNRDYIRMELKNKNIYCPIHWPRFQEVFAKKSKLYDEQLSLVIDQRYNFENMTLILNTIENCLVNEG
jgi:dTDP-4-amino-4,6-dideoxygalactose transaminase